MPRKEWEMAFAVTANMGSGFQSTFSKAQQQIASLQKDIKALNDQQSDIAAFQKQQQAVESTAKKMEVLQQQYDNIQREIQETGGFSSDLENKLLSKQLQIDKTSQSLERQTQELNRMGDSLHEAGIDTSNLAGESKRLEAELGDLKQQQVEVAESAEDYGTRGAKAFDAVGQALVAAGIARGMKEIYDAYAQCIGIAGDFEAAMSNVEALSGASAGEIERLSDLAKELGATTKFTAKESADAMGYMAMAGWSAEQMLAGMPGVLSLAAASGEDLATVSDIVTDSMTAFGLKASDTQRYADILAQTASKANTNVSMMGETFKYAAPLAGSLGYDVEDVAVATGLMANAGIKAGEAGTVLRSLFTRLAKPTKESADAMEALGISLTDDAGKMIPFMEIMERLRDRFAGLTEEQQAFYAAELAGQRGMSGLLAIVNAADSDFASLSASISNSAGAAERMASIKMDNMVGQLTIFNSALEAVETTIGEQFTGDLENLYGWGAQVLGQVNDFIQRNPGLVKGITVTVGAIGTMTAAITALAAAKKLASAIDLAAMFAGPTGWILAGAAAAAALVGTIVALTESSRQYRKEVEEATKASRELNTVFEEGQEKLDQTSAQSEAAGIMAGRYIDKIDDLKAAMDSGELSAEDYAHAQREYTAILELLTDTVPELSGLINVETGEIEGGTAALRRNTEAWVENAKAQAMQEYFAEASKKYAEAEAELARNRILLEKAEQNELWQLHQEWERLQAIDSEDLTDSQRERLQEFLFMDWSGYDKAEREVRKYTDAVIIGERQVAQAADDMQLAEKVFNSAMDAFEQDVDDEGIKTIRDDAALMNSVLDDTLIEVGNLITAYQDAYAAAYNSISGQYKLWDDAADVAATKTGDINTALESQRKYWDDYNANLSALSDRAGEIEGLREVIASFADGSEDSVNAIAGMAQASDEDLAAMVKNWQELQKAHDETAKNLAEFQTNFTAQMDELTGQIKEDVGELNLSDEAAENGRATIQAYIDAMDDMLPEVQAAFDRFTAAANFGITLGHGNKVYLDNIPAHAAGTKYAEPGLSLVGEHGPELRIMHGGEEIVNARETRRLMAESAEIMNFAPLLAALSAQPVSAAVGDGNAAPVSVSVNINVEGNATETTVEALTAYGDEFAERVRAVLEDAGIESARREYR